MTNTQRYKLTEFGRRILFLLSDHDGRYFPNNPEDLDNLPQEYADAWIVLIRMGCLIIDKDRQGEFVFMLVDEAGLYANYLALIHEVEDIFKDVGDIDCKTIRTSLLDVKALSVINRQ
jgi:hypothetical protein